MCKALFLSMLVLLTITISAQEFTDVIISYDYDTSVCKITEIKSGKVYYDTYVNGKVQSKILHYKLIRKSQINVDGNLCSKKWCFEPLIPVSKVIYGINGGYSEKFGYVPDGLNEFTTDYLLNLNTGFSVGGDFAYILGQSNGLFSKINVFKSWMKPIPIVLVNDDESSLSGMMSDNITIIYFCIGPTFRLNSKYDQSSFFINPGVGLQFYRNKSVLIEEYFSKGKTFGFGFDIGYDKKIKDNIALGIQFSYTLGILKELTISGNDVDESLYFNPSKYTNITRFDLGLSIKFMN